MHSSTRRGVAVTYQVQLSNGVAKSAAPSNGDSLGPIGFVPGLGRIGHIPTGNTVQRTTSPPAHGAWVLATVVAGPKRGVTTAVNGGPTGHGLADWTCNRRASGALRVLRAQAFSQGPLGPTNPPHGSPDVANAAEGVPRAGGGATPYPSSPRYWGRIL